MLKALAKALVTSFGTRQQNCHLTCCLDCLDIRFAFDQWLPQPVASLLERAGGPRTIGLHAWYRHSNEDAWSSFKAWPGGLVVLWLGSRLRMFSDGSLTFGCLIPWHLKVLVLHRGSLGSNWTLGASDLSWTLQVRLKDAESLRP